MLIKGERQRNSVSSLDFKQVNRLASDAPTLDARNSVLDHVSVLVNREPTARPSVTLVKFMHGICFLLNAKTVNLAQKYKGSYVKRSKKRSFVMSWIRIFLTSGITRTKAMVMFSTQKHYS